MAKKNLSTNGNGNVEELRKSCAEALIQVSTAGEQAASAIVALVIDGLRLAIFEGENTYLPDIWNLPQSAKTWQNKARILACYMAGKAIPITSKTGKVSYSVDRNAIKKEKNTFSFLAEAKTYFADNIRKHDLKGLRKASNALALIDALKWTPKEKTPEKEKTAAEIADMIAGISNIAARDAEKIAKAIELLRG